MKQQSIRKIILASVAVLTVFSASAQKITVSELKDKIAGAWIGQMVGNIYGLPFENKFIENPGNEADFPYGYTKSVDKLVKYDGAFSDDDTDVEYLYLMLMEKFGIEPTYAQMREGWMYHIRDRVWLANRASLGLMHYGFTPPFTGSKENNPHWYQIDPQLINEIWAYTAPGMISYASEKSDWAARITSDSWAVSPTVLYGAMYANAFFCKDVRKLIVTALKELPAEDRYAKTVKEMVAFYDAHPNDWVAARQAMAKKYYVNEPEMTKTIWNANLNGACGILAMLYGKGNFQHTLDLCCAMGFDADNQAATVSGILGVMYGAHTLPAQLTMPVKNWKKPFNDRYINITRYDMPDASIEDMINRTVKEAVDLVCSKGGKLKGDVLFINNKAHFKAPLEFYIGPDPDMEVGKEIDYSYACLTNAGYKWSLVKGELPSGVTFKDGKLSGTPQKAGKYNIRLQLANNGQSIEKDFELIVRTRNIAQQSDTIYANVREVNKQVLDSCWITFGKPMYAKNVDVIKDGIKRGEGSVFYSLASKSNLPKIDYFGYGWKENHTIDMIALNTGCLEEFGGWFTSLNVQYLGEDGHWYDVGKFKSTPALPETDIVYFQPHFAEYVIEFKPVNTKGIRIIFDDKVQPHWNKYTKNVSSFISITELSVYEQ